MPGPLDALRNVFGWGQTAPKGPPMLDEKDAQEWPEMASSWAGRNIENPTASAQVGRIRPMNFLEKVVLPGAQGYTSPWGTIAYNRNNLPNEDLGDFLAHELVHIEQQNRPGSGIIGGLRSAFSAPKPYTERDYEREAFAREGQRPVRRSDIRLPRGPR